MIKNKRLRSKAAKNSSVGSGSRNFQVSPFNLYLHFHPLFYLKTFSAG
jgi:hypothetical protein